MFRYFEGCRYGSCVECHEKCEAAMDGSRLILAAVFNIAEASI
mgnify:CR=1 FL=1